MKPVINFYTRTRISEFVYMHLVFRLSRLHVSNYILWFLAGLFFALSVISNLLYCVFTVSQRSHCIDKMLTNVSIQYFHTCTDVLLLHWNIRFLQSVEMFYLSSKNTKSMFLIMSQSPLVWRYDKEDIWNIFSLTIKGIFQGSGHLSVTNSTALKHG